jgi:hypothetical protein
MTKDATKDVEWQVHSKRRSRTKSNASQSKRR